MRHPGMRQRGSVAVELGLSIPVLLVLVLGGLHLGRVISSRNRLGDATSYAARHAAQTGQSDGTAIRNDLLAAFPDWPRRCASTPTVTATVNSDSLLEVTATCTLSGIIGSSWLTGAVLPDRVSTTVAMPFLARTPD